MTECFSEPTLDEVLSDPLVQDVMASDGAGVPARQPLLPDRPLDADAAGGGLWTKSQIACTRAQPGGVLPNRFHAAQQANALVAEAVGISRDRARRCHLSMKTIGGGATQS
jgi:hypothetical protein